MASSLTRTLRSNDQKFLWFLVKAPNPMTFMRKSMPSRLFCLRPESASAADTELSSSVTSLPSREKRMLSTAMLPPTLMFTPPMAGMLT